MARRKGPRVAAEVVVEPARGHRRRNILICTGVALTVLLIVLTVGLALGLTMRKPSPPSESYVPLPPGAEVYTSEAILGVVGGGRTLECGWRTEDGDQGVAIGADLYDAATAEAGGDPQQNRLCGRRLRATRLRTENRPEQEWRDVSVDATVSGRCKYFPTWTKFYIVDRY